MSASLLTMPLGEYTCPACGRVHMRISRQYAEECIRDANKFVKHGTPWDIDRYLRCFGCGRPTSTFVPAKPDDAPAGVTLTPCVID